MKSRSSRERQSICSKSKLLENNFQSARQNENNSRLSNLLNLSQFNCHDGLINKSTAAFVAGINHKINKNRKSPLLELSSNYVNQNCAKVKDGAASGDIQKNQESSPQKCIIKTSKSKRSKSNKRHILSCNQILSIVKKRDTFSMMTLQNSKGSIIANYGSTKQKKKQKKQQQTIKTTNTTRIKSAFPVSLNNSKGINIKDETVENFVANYPLSMSHSYIVFSEKDSSLNNTTNILNKMSKKLSSSNQNRVLELHQKLELIKNEHAVTIIQKNWRGYLTRKLLQDYISSEEAKLVHKLTFLQSQRKQYENFQKMSPGCNKLWSNIDQQCSEISQIFEQQQKISKRQSQCQESNGASSLNSNNQTLSLSQADDEQSYRKKQPVINQILDENQMFESILQHEDSPNITSRQRQNEGYQMAIQPKQSGIEYKSILTQNSSRDLRKKMNKCGIVQVYSETLNNIRQDSQEEAIKQILQNISKKIWNFMNEMIQKQKKSLSYKVKIKELTFDLMLQKRQQMKKISLQLQNNVNVFCTSIEQIFDQIYSITGHCRQNQDQEQIEKQLCEGKQSSQGLFNLFNKNSEEKFKKISLHEDKILPEIIKQEVEYPPKTGSPISEYFTIELPTQQLSPFKPVLSSGLESLKTYLGNLHQEFTNDADQCSQTNYLCKVLKKHSQIGPQNMIERCLIQMLVQMLTCQYLLSDLILAVDYLTGEAQMQDGLEDSSCIDFIRKWAEQLEKWELGPIQQVSGNMEQSANITQRKHRSNDKLTKSPDFMQKLIEQ